MAEGRGVAQNVELRHVRAFLVLCEVGTVTEAAALLKVSQPSLSQLLARLEATLGSPLFDRTRNGLVLTTAGRRLKEQVAAPAQQLFQAFRTWDDVDDRPKVAICAGATPAALERAMQLLGWNSADIDWLDVPTSQQAGLLLAGSLEAAVGREPIGYARSLGSVELGLEMGSSSPLVHRTSVSYEELTGYRLAWIQEQRTASYQDTVLNHIHRRGWEPELVLLPPRTALLHSALTSDPHLVVLRPEGQNRGPWIRLEDPPSEEFWLST